MICVYCKEDKETRPYGPNFSAICFRCMMATPEREAEASKNYLAQLDACGGVAIIGEETGPRPLNTDSLV